MKKRKHNNVFPYIILIPILRFFAKNVSKIKKLKFKFAGKIDLNTLYGCKFLHLYMY